MKAGLYAFLFRGRAGQALVEVNEGLAGHGACGDFQEGHVELFVGFHGRRLLLTVEEGFVDRRADRLPLLKENSVGVRLAACANRVRRTRRDDDRGDDQLLLLFVANQVDGRRKNDGRLFGTARCGRGERLALLE